MGVLGMGECVCKGKGREGGREGEVVCVCLIREGYG